MNNKTEHKQNLIYPQLRIKYVYDRAIIPVLLIVIVTTLIIGGATYGKAAVINVFKDRIDSTRNDSTKAQYEQMIQQKDELQNQLNMLKSGSGVVMANVRYDEKSLLDYLIKNKPSSISIIMIEDNRVTSGASGGGPVGAATTPQVTPEGTAQGTPQTDSNGVHLVQSDSLTVGDVVKGTVDGVTNGVVNGVNEIANGVTTPDASVGVPATNLPTLKYTGDIGTSTINLRGFAVSQADLSKYMKALSDLRIISNYQIKAIESVRISNYSIWLFDVVLTPYV